MAEIKRGFPDQRWKKNVETVLHADKINHARIAVSEKSALSQVVIFPYLSIVRSPKFTAVTFTG